MAWKDTAAANANVLDLMVKEMAKNRNDIPTRLVETANIISMISSAIESLKANHKANLKPLVHQASGLIVVLRRLYLNDRYPSIWPPPPLNWTVDKFVKTVDSIRKLLERRCEKTFVKKMIFVVLDMGKVKKYLCKLDAVATKIEEGDSNPRHIVDVNEVLLEAVNEYNDAQDEEAQLLEAIVEDIPDAIFERLRQQEVKKSSLAEIVEAIEEDHEVGTSTQSSRETLTSQSSPPSPRHASFNNTGSIEEDHEVGTSTQRSRETLTSQSSPPSPRHASFNNTGSIEEDHEVEISTQASRETPTSQSSESSSESSPQHINMSFNNNAASDVMITGSYHKTIIRNVGNDNSVNHYRR